MNSLVSAQAISFIMSILSGLFLGFVYDLVRVLRRIIKHPKWLINVQDFIFWLFGSFIIFLDIFKNNNGVLRGFLYIGVFLGLIIYFFLISKLVLMIFMKIYSFIAKIIKFLFKIIIGPIKLLLRPINFVVRKIYKLLKKFGKWLIIKYKKIIKDVKVIFKKK
ncbi:spore cortex biosynthesis protein YabQ [Vallitalea guaymasensis]|uniref:spore cortex biosynthesis protein YabQ n=1 Tax=Vallitalea guaymasensis TaxID=1185412 RepID=UPI00272A7716|nr:spore cortex biosynthesis protein YabQ [Vallitalea guaymasensis]